MIKLQYKPYCKHKLQAEREELCYGNIQPTHNPKMFEIAQRLFFPKQIIKIEQIAQLFFIFFSSCVIGNPSESVIGEGQLNRWYALFSENIVRKNTGPIYYWNVP